MQLRCVEWLRRGNVAASPRRGKA